jgi:hypothetical protein
VVLHDISNDAKLIKVTASALSAERLLEGDLDVVDVVAVPGSAEERVTEAKDQDVLHHLLAKIVVNSEQLLFVPVGLKRLLQLARAGKILSKRLLDNDTSNAVLGIADLLEVLRDNGEDTGRQSHVKETMGLGSTLLELLQMLVQDNEGLVLIVLTGDVGATVAELVKLLLRLLGGGLHVRLDTSEVLIVVHLGASISDDLDILREELVSIQAKERGVRLLFSEITRSSKHDDGRVLLELHSRIHDGRNVGERRRENSLRAQVEEESIGCEDGGQDVRRVFWEGRRNRAEQELG